MTNLRTEEALDKMETIVFRGSSIQAEQLAEKLEAFDAQYFHTTDELVVHIKEWRQYGVVLENLEQLGMLHTHKVWLSDVEKHNASGPLAKAPYTMGGCAGFKSGERQIPCWGRGHVYNRACDCEKN